MKKLLFLVIATLSSMTTFAQNVPPPTANRGGAPPPGLPIDQYLIVLFAIGIFAVAFFNKKIIKTN